MGSAQYKKEDSRIINGYLGENGVPYKNKEDKNAYERDVYAHTPKTSERRAVLAAKMKAWRVANPDKDRANKKRCYAAHREENRAKAQAYYRANEVKLREYRKIHGRRNHVKHKFGLLWDEYESLKAQQGGRCLICKEEKKLGVDHDHSTGKVRGLLCSNCNSAIGMLNDNVELLKAAIAYLKSSKS